MVRSRYQQACGYCGVTEITVGGALTLDHYQPRAAGGGDDPDNLIYACVRCNQYKGNFWPGNPDLAQGWRVLHPGIDDDLVHMVEDENTGYLRGLTPTGDFHRHRTTTATLVVIVLSLPLVVRNYRLFGVVGMPNTNVGINFFWANHPIHGTHFEAVLSPYLLNM